MNIENAKRAITVMERVQTYPPDHFNMSFWVCDYSCDIDNDFTEENALECGTAACFLGWMALARDIPEISFDAYESPTNKDGSSSTGTLAEFLEISIEDSYALCGLKHFDSEEYFFDNDNPYYVERDGTPQDVINKLNQLIEDNS